MTFFSEEEKALHPVSVFRMPDENRQGFIRQFLEADQKTEATISWQ